MAESSTCGVQVASCHCTNASETCDGMPHACACGGSWSGDQDASTFRVHSFPSRPAP